MYNKLTPIEQVERELIALIFYKNEIVDLLQIKPKYLLTKINENIL